MLGRNPFIFFGGVFVAVALGLGLCAFVRRQGVPSGVQHTGVGFRYESGTGALRGRRARVREQGVSQSAFDHGGRYVK